MHGQVRHRRGRESITHPRDEHILGNNIIFRFGFGSVAFRPIDQYSREPYVNYIFSDLAPTLLI